MSVLKIHEHDDSVVDSIRVRVEEGGGDVVYIHNSHHRVSLGDYEDSILTHITSKMHALDVIKGLEKAIELGWLK